MSTPIIACCALLFAGMLIGATLLIRGVRDLPRWILIAQFLIALTFIAGAAAGFGLNSSFGRLLTPPMHRFIFLQIVLVVGMGLGIILLLLVSGEYFRALRELDAARMSRLANEHKA